MSASVTPIPSDRPRLGPYITVNDGAAAIDFYKHALGAVEKDRMAEPDGKIAHAELKFGDSVLMLSDEYPEHGAKSPKTIGGSPVLLHLYVEDADEVVARAVQAGAKIEEPVDTQFYGDRGGKITDPFGHRWWIASRVEDVPIDEQRRRAVELYGVS